MNLRDFLSETLQQIVLGISDAQAEAIKYGAKINPRGRTVARRDESGHMEPHDTYTKIPINQIEFDVAITATKGKETKGGIGVAIASIGIGAQGKSGKTDTTVSRIKFTVPVSLPPQDETLQ